MAASGAADTPSARQSPAVTRPYVGMDDGGLSYDELGGDDLGRGPGASSPHAKRQRSGGTDLDSVSSDDGHMRDAESVSDELAEEAAEPPREHVLDAAAASMDEGADGDEEEDSASTADTENGPPVVTPFDWNDHTPAQPPKDARCQENGCVKSQEIHFNSFSV